jgi:hypothetical protein
LRRLPSQNLTGKKEERCGRLNQIKVRSGQGVSFSVEIMSLFFY